MPAGSTAYKVTALTSNGSQNSAISIRSDSTNFIAHEKSGDASYWSLQEGNRGVGYGNAGGTGTLYTSSTGTLYLSGASSNKSLAILLQMQE